MFVCTFSEIRSAHWSRKAVFWAHISVQSGCRGLLPRVTKSSVLGPHVRAIGLPGVPATCHETLLLVYRMYKMGNAKCMHFWCGAAEPQSIRIGTNFEYKRGANKCPPRIFRTRSLAQGLQSVVGGSSEGVLAALRDAMGGRFGASGGHREPCVGLPSGWALARNVCLFVSSCVR